MKSLRWVSTCPGSNVGMVWCWKDTMMIPSSSLEFFSHERQAKKLCSVLVRLSSILLSTTHDCIKFLWRRLDNFHIQSDPPRRLQDSQLYYTLYCVCVCVCVSSIWLYDKNDIIMNARTQWRLWKIIFLRRTCRHFSVTYDTYLFKKHNSVASLVNQRWKSSD